MTVKRFRFSLIELLAVIALVSLLTALMLPAFRKMTAGNAVDQMASQIKLALEQAQSHAAVSRRLTAVIFYMDSNIKLKFGGYRLAEVEKDTTGNYKFTQWVEDSDWKPRVDGAILSKITTTNPSQENNNPIPDLPTNKDHYIGCDNKNHLNDKTESLVKVSPSNGEFGDKENSIIFRPTGGAVATESKYSRFFVISEAIVDNNGITYPNQHNYRIIKISLLTGRCEYIR